MKRVVSLALVLAVLICSPVLSRAKGDLTPSAKDKCPVCGMFVAKFPNWVASARFKDGTTYFFDGPKDLFTHYFDTGRYTPGRQQSDIISLSVKEYYSLKMIDARSAFFVTGSNVNGPMGSELIPLATEQDAAAFLKDHKGKRILRFKEITKKLLYELK